MGTVIAPTSHWVHGKSLTQWQEPSQCCRNGCSLSWVRAVTEKGIIGIGWETEIGGSARQGWFWEHSLRNYIYYCLRGLGEEEGGDAWEVSMKLLASPGWLLSLCCSSLLCPSRCTAPLESIPLPAVLRQWIKINTALVTSPIRIRQRQAFPNPKPKPDCEGRSLGCRKKKKSFPEVLSLWTLGLTTESMQRCYDQSPALSSGRRPPRGMHPWRLQWLHPPTHPPCIHPHNFMLQLKSTLQRSGCVGGPRPVGRVCKDKIFLALYLF